MATSKTAIIAFVAACCLPGGAASSDTPLIPELREVWWIRRGIESDMLAVGLLIQRTVSLLKEGANAAHWKGKQRWVFVNAGRAIRLIEASQTHLLEINQRKTTCGNCGLKIGKCKCSVSVSGLSIEPRYVKEGGTNQNKRYLIANQNYRQRGKALTKTQAWDLYWQLNTVKAMVFILRCQNSLCKNERKLLKQLEQLWGE